MDETNLKNLEKFLFDLQSALGQMNHISSRYACEHGERPRNPMSCHHEGLMAMPVNQRSDLCVRAFELWNQLRKEN